MSLDIIPDPFVILQPDGTINDVNASFAKLVEKKKEELIGADFRQNELFKSLGERVTQAITYTTEDYERTSFKNRHFEVLILPFVINTDVKLIRIIFKDITNFVRLENELLKRNHELIIISTLSSVFISSENMDLVVEDLLEKVMLVTDFKIGWILLNGEQSFRLKTSRGISSEFQKKIENGVLETICKDIIKKGEPFYIIESADMSRFSFLQKEGIDFLFSITLFSNKSPIGLLFLASREAKKENIDFDMAALLSLIGNNVSLILDKIKLFQETKRLSITDGLTGLYNRRYFYKYLDLEIARTKRYGDSFSVMLFDIDNFKNINDTYGHQAGDDVLVELSEILKMISRETDVVARYGGEEFIIILPNTGEIETIALANRIKTAVEKNIFMINNSEAVKMTLSGGIASFPQNASDAKSLLIAADSALYAAKATGKNKILPFKGFLHEKSI